MFRDCLLGRESQRDEEEAGSPAQNRAVMSTHTRGAVATVDASNKTQMPHQMPTAFPEDALIRQLTQCQNLEGVSVNYRSITLNMHIKISFFIIS